MLFKTLQRVLGKEAEPNSFPNTLVVFQKALLFLSFSYLLLPWPKKTATTIMHEIRTLFLPSDNEKSSMIGLRCAAMREVAASRANVPISCHADIA